MITRDQIARMFPRGNQAWVDKLVELAPGLVKHYGWSILDWRHAMGQVYAETSGLSLASMRENMRFTTARRIKEVYSYRLRLALQRDRDLAREHGTVDGLAQFLVGKPDLLADIVYGGREGTPHGQGHRYIGRGITQITHLNNYRAIEQEIRRQPGADGVPSLVDTPEALEQPEMGIRALFADWKIKGLSRWANADDIENVSSVLNVGSAGKWGSVNGQGNRKQGYARACGIWPDDALDAGPVEAPQVAAPVLKRGDECQEVSDLQFMLKDLGLHSGEIDGCYGELTERAVVYAQHKHGLPPTGEADARTIDVLKRSAKVPLPREEMTVEDLERRGSRTVSQAQEITTWGRVLKWFGLGTGGAGAAETVSPGSVSQFVSLAPKVADTLASPAMLKLAAIAFGAGLLVLGFRLAASGKKIVLFRLEDAKTGAHVGR